MNEWYVLLERRLLRFYFWMALCVIIVMNGYNVYIDGSSWAHIFRYDFYYVLIGTTAVFAMLAAFTRRQLRHVKQYCAADRAEDTQQAAQAEAWRRLLRFPALLGFVFAAGIILLSAVYHAAEVAWFRIRPLNMMVIRHVMIEMAAGAALAMLLYGFARLKVAPYAARLAKQGLEGMRRTTLLWPWLGSFASLLALTCIMLVWSVLNSEHLGGVHLATLLAASLLILLFSLLVLRLVTSGLVRDIAALTEGMQKLRTDWPSQRPLPVVSRDETGQLAAAFNELQVHIKQEYTEIRNELQLAYEVQQRLLPAAHHEIGCLHIAAHTQPASEVGGDLFDVLRLPSQHVIVAIGDVSGKGMSAALVMTAVISLIRAEARRGGTAGDIMTRINRQLCDTLHGSMMVTLGIAVLDSSNGEMSYASAGHLAPYIRSASGWTTQLFSSLPLGIDAGQQYEQWRVQLAPEDCIVLYTDGVVEQLHDDGTMIGFERFEAALGATRCDSSPQEKLAEVRERLFGSDDAGRTQPELHHDDWTLIMIQRTKEGEAVRA